MGIHGVELEVAMSEHMAFFRYADRPGVIGVLGRLLGQAGVNIAGMQVGRDHEGGAAVVVLTLDSAIPADVLDDDRRGGRRPDRPDRRPHAQRAPLSTRSHLRGTGRQSRMPRRSVNYLDFQASRRTVEEPVDHTPGTRHRPDRGRPTTSGNPACIRSQRCPAKVAVMTEAQQLARRALQESMDLRDQGHSDD